MGSRTIFAAWVAGMVGITGSLSGAEPRERAVDSLSERQVQVLKMNPVGYWPADEGEGHILRDITPNKNHAELHNLEWADGLLYFRGLFQWAEIPASEQYQSRTFSMGGWIFLRDRVRGGWNDRSNRGYGMTFFGNGYHTSSYSLATLNADEVLFQKSDWGVGGGSPDGASIRIRRGQRIDILSHGEDDAMKTAEHAEQIAIGEWQHILYTYENPAPMEGGPDWVGLQDNTHFENGGVGKVYVNGQLVKSTNRVQFTPRMAPFLIGSDANWWLQSTTSGSLDGSVRDLVLFDRALGEEEVASLFAGTHPAANPQVFSKSTVLLNERPLDLKNLEGLSATQTWEVLQQLKTFEVDDLARFTPWLKTQKDALAVDLLLKLGEHEHVSSLVPDYMKIFENKNLSDEERADALLALVACKDLAGDAALGAVLTQLSLLQPQRLKVEDYYRNALIYAVFEMDPTHEILKTITGETEGRFFSKGNEMRDARPTAGNQRAYTSSVEYQGKIYRCGEGVAFRGVEPVSPEEFEEIAKEMEGQYPTIRRWAEGKRLARVVISITDSEGVVEKVFPLGRTFIFDQTDEKLAGWSLAFDQDGYVHLTGGMHNAPDETNFMPGSWESWGLSRELQDDQYPTIPYWVSKMPGDVSSFECVGQRGNTRNIPLALGLNYINFVQDRNQELYIYGRIHVQGLQSWGMYRYDTKTKRWTGLGGFAPDVKKEYPLWSDRFITMAADWLALPSIRWKHDHPRSRVLAWSRQPHFYNYIRGWGMRWDPDNRLHTQVSLFGLDPNNRNTDMPLYAYSDDDGRTFYDAAGRQLELPLTANPGPGNAGIQTRENLKRWNLWVALLNKTDVRSELRTF